MTENNRMRGDFYRLSLLAVGPTLSQSLTIKMSLPNYLLLVSLLLPVICNAQQTMTSLGVYNLGKTTPDSLKRFSFKEEQVYVKGTIALPCPHIRVFRSVTTPIWDTSVDKLTLVFHDNTLVKISCDYSPTLRDAFLARHGSGTLQPIRSYQACPVDSKKPLQLWGELWPGDITKALAVYQKGYNMDCIPEEKARLVLFNQPVLILSSECELNDTDPMVDEFIKSLK